MTQKQQNNFVIFDSSGIIQTNNIEPYWAYSSIHPLIQCLEKFRKEDPLTGKWKWESNQERFQT